LLCPPFPPSPPCVGEEGRGGGRQVWARTVPHFRRPTPPSPQGGVDKKGRAKDQCSRTPPPVPRCPAIHTVLGKTCRRLSRSPGFPISRYLKPRLFSFTNSLSADCPACGGRGLEQPAYRRRPHHCGQEAPRCGRGASRALVAFRPRLLPRPLEAPCRQVSYYFTPGHDSNHGKDLAQESCRIASPPSTAPATTIDSQFVISMTTVLCILIDQRAVRRRNQNQSGAPLPRDPKRMARGGG